MPDRFSRKEPLYGQCVRPVLFDIHLLHANTYRRGDSPQWGEVAHRARGGFPCLVFATKNTTSSAQTTMLTHRNAAENRPCPVAALTRPSATCPKGAHLARERVRGRGELRANRAWPMAPSHSSAVIAALLSARRSQADGIETTARFVSIRGMWTIAARETGRASAGR